MIEWGLENGIEWNKSLECFDFKDTGRGVIANNDIKENEILISIPSKYLIHSHSKFSIPSLNIPELNNSDSSNSSSSSDDIYTPFHNCLKKLNSKQRISLILIIEKLIKKHSIWFNYLNELPDDYTITSTYSDEEIESLSYPIYVESSKKLKNEMLNSFKLFCEIFQLYYGTDLDRVVIELNDLQVKLSDILNKELYIWCWGTIQTRTYFYDKNMKKNNSKENNEEKDDCTLVPLADLFNHTSNVETEALFNDELNCYQVKTKTPFSKGSQVFISYGKHSNFTLMNYYGFIIENNDQDSIPLLQSNCIPTEFAVPPTSSDEAKLYEKKIGILNNYGLSIYSDGKFLVMQDEKLPFSWNYLTVLKVLYMTKEEINNQLELNLFHYDEPISKNNENLVLSFLENLTENQLSFFKNTKTKLNSNNISRFEITYLINSNIKTWECCKLWLEQQQKNINQNAKEKSTNLVKTTTPKKSTKKSSKK
ncbi:hypothetical protein DICPUDRAFT_32466 [Dictyostelium purpureum]|uniref:SET domain-containing protein n=1 Tax=Dictyostelium purpureum TaxID=5786 RepID=F0ZJ42_DICPU|nr:uncharacterized protein DICPUDRAFT_32466 [Dictyostelium purpureum]EGC36043.1 hypothetical protein DICPUDRAFT_32466 [Dictyostelium purpureum]|eukprot:XP_003287418.1 hypothetical protein DICPUDRAFT_32466 [Dictyostelium purpureum]